MKISSNGVKLNVNDTGTPIADGGKGDIALVFLHFWGGSSLTWNEVTARLRNRFRCISIDARGAGDSEAPSTGYSTNDHANDALNVIKALGLKRYILIGHSMGGKAAQLLASHQPQGLIGLVLVASSPPSPMAIDDAMRAQMKAAYADRDAVEWSLNNVLVGSPLSVESRSQLITDALRLSSPAKAGWVDIGTREDIREQTAQIHVPVTIVAGELDRVDPVAVVKDHILPYYPNAVVHFLPNKGHLLPVEAPEEIAGLIRDMAEVSQPICAR